MTASQPSFVKYNDDIYCKTRLGPYMSTRPNKETRSCFIIDAAADSKELVLREFINHSPHIDHLVYVTQHDYDIPVRLLSPGLTNTQTTSCVQKDNFSCSIFSLEYSHLSSETPGLHEWLLAKAKLVSNSTNQYAINWSELPPKFVRLSQSPTYKTYYTESKRSTTPLVDTFFSITDFESVRDNFKTIAQTKVDELPEEKLREQVQPRFSPRGHEHFPTF